MNVVFLILASLCVGFILGWLVGRPRRWGVFAADVPVPGTEQPGVDTFAHGG
ncbi:LapA family protein [Actinomadura sp. DC4]|uniref:LapA family protein n=1 Tax=Actinomadura sp. DC4 TaxID=3055069 RepID=UPI0025AFFF01|nr:LapA family protein [Actinomadura sp. DC4]MDN3351009.1 LapA family protein [Actinomadura sp. DC4]